MTRAEPAPEWMTSAACAGMEPEIFFLSPYDRSEDANNVKAICNRCPVVAECLQWALDTRDDWAILGGTTPTERRKIRAARRVA